jgi:hypothetical protein
MANFFEGKILVQRFPDIRGGQAGRDHVAEISGNMEESGGAQSRFMGKSEEREARANAGPEQAEAVVALLLKPAQRAAHVQDRLPVGLQREADIRADQMIGTRMSGDGAAVVIWQADFDGGDAQKLQPAADILLFFPARIPLGEHDHGGAMTTGFENLGVDPIIFGPGRFDGAGESSDVFVERITGGGSGGEPVVAMSESVFDELVEPGAGIAVVRVAANVFEAPFERQDAPVLLLREAHLFVGQDLLFEPGHRV